jgi:hypothetical protein
VDSVKSETEFRWSRAPRMFTTSARICDPQPFLAAVANVGVAEMQDHLAAAPDCGETKAAALLPVALGPAAGSREPS